MMLKSSKYGVFYETDQQEIIQMRLAQVALTAILTSQAIKVGVDAKDCNSLC